MPIKHPMVEVNLFNDKETLFLGNSPHESFSLLGPLSEKITIEYVLNKLLSGIGSYVHKWEEGDLLIWDNIQVMHRAEG